MKYRTRPGLQTCSVFFMVSTVDQIFTYHTQSHPVLSYTSCAIFTKKHPVCGGHSYNFGVLVTSFVKNMFHESPHQELLVDHLTTRWNGFWTQSALRWCRGQLVAAPASFFWGGGNWAARHFSFLFWGVRPSKSPWFWPLTEKFRFFFLAFTQSWGANWSGNKNNFGGICPPPPPCTPWCHHW